MKAFSSFLLLFALASTQGFSQVTKAAGEQEQAIQEQKSENHTLEASIYQEQLAAEANKPIKYGPSTAPRKKYYRSSSSRKKYYSKRRR